MDSLPNTLTETMTCMLSQLLQTLKKVEDFLKTVEVTLDDERRRITMPTTIVLRETRPTAAHEVPHRVIQNLETFSTTGETPTTTLTMEGQMPTVIKITITTDKTIPQSQVMNQVVDKTIKMETTTTIIPMPMEMKELLMKKTKKQSKYHGQDSRSLIQ